MLKSIDALFRAFDNAGVQYCHWKSNLALSEAENGETDLDILFMPSQRNLVEQCLAECNLKLFLQVGGQAYNGILDYIGFDYESAKIWHLHLHYRLSIGEEYVKGYTLNWGDNLISRRVFHEECRCWTTRPEDELLLLFSRIALKLRPIDYFRQLNTHDKSEAEYLIANTTKEHFCDAVEFFLGGEAVPIYQTVYECFTGKKTFFKLRHYLRSKLSPFSDCSTIRRSFLSIKKELLLYARAAIIKVFGLRTSPKKRIIPSGGMFVAIIGGDGSGKSTTVKYVTDEFRKKIDVYKVYLGSGKGSSALSRRGIEVVGRFIYRKYKKAGGTAEKEVHKSTKEYDKLSLKQKIVLTAKALWVNELASEKKRKLRSAVKARNAGMLVIGDRYPQIDTPGVCDGPMLTNYMELKNYIGRKARKEFSVYSNSYINPPDIIIRLTVPTEVALSRRPEMDEEQMLQKQNAVKSIRVPSKYYDVDTSRPFEETISEVMSSIWENI